MVRKFAVQSIGLFAVERVRGLWRVAYSDDFVFVSRPDSRSITPISVLANALKAGLILPVLSAIANVFRSSGNSKIDFAAYKTAIVQRVVKAMVPCARIALLKTQNLSVHVHRFMLSGRKHDSSNSIKTLRVAIPIRAPFGLINPVKILSINNRNLPLRQRDFAVRLFSGHPENLLLGGLGRARQRSMPLSYHLSVAL